MTYYTPNANKGRALEELIKYQNQLYQAKEIANIQKISTPWQVIRSGGRIISAFPEGKSTLDFRGTVKGGIPVSFDAKETEDGRGLPLKAIAVHQIDYMRGAVRLGEITFLVCFVRPKRQCYVIDGPAVIACWDEWKAHPNKQGYCYIPVGNMRPVISRPGNVCDYLSAAGIWKGEERT